jgi:outer membrane lipoprotein-sorting protein
MKSLLIISLFFLAVFQINAQERITDENEARIIFEELDERRNSIETELSDLTMVITDNRGRNRTRMLRSWIQNSGDDTMTLIIFAEPGNVRGTGFLSINEGGTRTQRLYLPSVGRIQVIGSAERGDRFMGSDFTYEDLGDQDPDDFEFEWLETSETHHTIRASKPGSDQYAYLEFEIIKETFALETVRYFNSAGEEIKRLEAEDFEQLTDRLWSPRKMTMYDHVENRKTELTWSNREINAEIEDWRFTERGLRRGI